MKNIESTILKVIGVLLAVTSSLDFFGFLPLPKTGMVPAVYQLAIAFGIGVGLIITPLKKLQAWYDKLINRKIDNV